MIFVRLVIAALAVSAAARAGDVFPFLKRGDPRIRSLESYIVEPIVLDGARIAVFPFLLEQGGRPEPPNPASALADALHAHVPGAEVLLLDARPDTLPQAAREAGAELAVDGRARRIYRRAGGGFVADVRVQLYDVGGDGPTLLWSARKRIEWRERHPAEECLLFLAEQLVFDWLDYAPGPE